MLPLNGFSGTLSLSLPYLDILLVEGKVLVGLHMGLVSCNLLTIPSIIVIYFIAFLYDCKANK